MKIFNIKVIVKTFMISGIVVIFNMTNVVSCFAVDEINTIYDFCNKYGVVNNGKVDDDRVYSINNDIKENGDIIIEYSNGSRSLYNIKTKNYFFKPLESDENIIFNNLDELSKCNVAYIHLKNDQMNKEIGEHSEHIYVDNLNTNEDLENYATKWLKDNYNITLDIPIYYDNTIEENGIGIDGLYNYDIYNGKYIPKSIEINQKYKEENIDIQTEKTLIHELTHYALNKLNKPSKDKDMTFEKECIKNGGNTNTGGIGILHSHLKCTI